MDILSADRRSENMRRIRSKDTKPELFLRKALHARGFRYSLYPKQVPGHPDLWMPKWNLAVYVHGCFWHRHAGCKYAYTPKSRIDFWTSKFEANMKRDKIVANELSMAGIRKLVVWECTINMMRKDMDFREKTMTCIEAFIKSEILSYEI